MKINIRDEIVKRTNERLKSIVEDIRIESIGVSDIEQNMLQRKKTQLRERQAELVKAMANGQIIKQTVANDHEIEYILHSQYLIRQKDNSMYLEEDIENRIAKIKNGSIVEDKRIEPVRDEVENGKWNRDEDSDEQRSGWVYDRRKAIQYAERWWNSYNPKYKNFENDCTNFISQCLYAGGAPMRKFHNRSKGWWYENNNWSYSWSVANAFRWYLSGSQVGLRGRVMDSAEKLSVGDVICYDFEGDGKWNHNTIVVAKDANGMPLVNAHSYNSRMRYWDYTDSTAYTPNIKYKFFRIIDETNT